MGLVLCYLLHFREVVLSDGGDLRDLGFRHLNLIDYNVGMNINKGKLSLYSELSSLPRFDFSFFLIDSVKMLDWQCDHSREGEDSRKFYEQRFVYSFLLIAFIKLKSNNASL